MLCVYHVQRIVGRGMVTRKRGVRNKINIDCARDPRKPAPLPTQRDAIASTQYHAENIVLRTFNHTLV